MAKQIIPTKAQLEVIVREMQMTGIFYQEGLREFKRRFILRVLNANQGHKLQAARELGMHRNTLARTIAELNLVEVEPGRWITAAERQPVRNSAILFRSYGRTV